MKKNTNYIEYILLIMIPMWCLIPLILAIIFSFLMYNLDQSLRIMFIRFFIFLPIFLSVSTGIFLLGKTNNQKSLIFKNILIYLLLILILISVILFFYDAYSLKASQSHSILLILILHYTCSIMTALVIVFYGILSIRSFIKKKKNQATTHN